jgi:SAM-dependent methyltransferase
LVAHSTLLTGKGLGPELACGRGANALYLAELGYQVVAMDGSINALRQCAAASRRQGLAVYPVVTDLDKTLLPVGAFQLISVIRYLNRDLFPAVVAALAPGGVLFYKTSNGLHLIDHPRFNPGFLLRDNELAEAFGMLEILAGEEYEGHSWILARNSTPEEAPLT